MLVALASSKPKNEPSQPTVAEAFDAKWKPTVDALERVNRQIEAAAAAEAADPHPSQTHLINALAERRPLDQLFTTRVRDLLPQLSEKFSDSTEVIAKASLDTYWWMHYRGIDDDPLDLMEDINRMAWKQEHPEMHPGFAELAWQYATFRSQSMRRHEAIQLVEQFVSGSMPEPRKLSAVTPLDLAR